MKLRSWAFIIAWRFSFKSRIFLKISTLKFSNAFSKIFTCFFSKMSDKADKVVKTDSKLRKTKKTSGAVKKTPNPKQVLMSKKNPWLNFMKEFRLNNKADAKTVLANGAAAYKLLGVAEKAKYAVMDFEPVVKHAGGGNSSKVVEKGSNKEK